LIIVLGVLVVVSAESRKPKEITGQ
jgi:hypothetical protein